jgi:hypothetical protein
MITISHLTPQQVKLLTMIWNCKSEEEYFSIVHTLPKDVQLECASMLQLISAEVQELELRSVEEYPLANQILSKFRKQS